jgi:hypothetical protein
LVFKRGVFRQEFYAGCPSCATLSISWLGTGSTSGSNNGRGWGLSIIHLVTVTITYYLKCAIIKKYRTYKKTYFKVHKCSKYSAKHDGLGSRLLSIMIA